MSVKFSQSFRTQAVEKALNRGSDVTLQSIADSLGVSISALSRWTLKAREHELELEPVNAMNKAKRPQDWTLEERLELVIACAALNEDRLGEYCREQGVFPHHIKQWKADFATNKGQAQGSSLVSDMKRLKEENKALKKEVNRKDRALAETAALLVLQKKVQAIWGNDEDSSL
jgi:transposase